MSKTYIDIWGQFCSEFDAIFPTFFQLILILISDTNLLQLASLQIKKRQMQFTECN